VRIVQRLAEAGPAVGDHRDPDCVSDIARDAYLLVHGQQRLRRAARAAGDKAAGVDRLEARIGNQPAAERVIGDRHVDEAVLVEEPAQCLGSGHGVHLPRETLPNAGARGAASLYIISVSPITAITGFWATHSSPEAARQYRRTYPMV